MIDLVELINEPNPCTRIVKEFNDANTREEEIQFKEKWGRVTNHNLFKEAFIELMKDTSNSTLNELKKYRQVIPKLIDYIEQLRTEYAFSILLSSLSFNESNNNKKWTKEDDELLIKMVCEDEITIKQIANCFQRSASSISARITYLVGVKRISQQVAWKFVGTANGSNFEANLVGTVYKD